MAAVATRRWCINYGTGDDSYRVQIWFHGKGMAGTSRMVVIRGDGIIDAQFWHSDRLCLCSIGVQMDIDVCSLLAKGVEILVVIAQMGIYAARRATRAAWACIHPLNVVISRAVGIQVHGSVEQMPCAIHRDTHRLVPVRIDPVGIGADRTIARYVIGSRLAVVSYLVKRFLVCFTRDNGTIFSVCHP